MTGSILKTVSILGIDGSGKTTVAKAFAENQFWPLASGFICPDYHLSSFAPFNLLSRDVARISVYADETSNFQLKLLALYLKMSLFRPVQNFFATTFSPNFLISERNPLIDVLVYGKFYSKLMGTKMSSQKDNSNFLFTATPKFSEELIRIERWIAVINQRTGKNLSIHEYPRFCLETLKQGSAHIIKVFAHEFQASFPDYVFYFDLPPEQAAYRLQAVKSVTEVHETREHLGVLSSTYRDIFASLAQLGAKTEIITLDAQESSGHLTDKILAHLKMVK